MRIGVIGLGGFGVKVAARLVERDFNPEVYDIDDMAVRYFTNETGGMTTGSPKMMAQSCDVVVTVMPDAAALREVFFGWEGLAGGLKPGAVVFDMSGCEPATARRIAEEIASRQASLVDAPAIGTPAQARAGELTLLVGGDEAAVERCAPVLAALAKTWHRAGAVGSGHALMAMGGYLRATGLLAMAEALSMGQLAGVDARALADIAGSLGFAGPAAIAAAKDQMAGGTFKSGTRVREIRQDLGLCGAILGEETASPPLLAAAIEAWRGVEASLGSGSDATSVLTWLERERAAKAAPVAA